MGKIRRLPDILAHQIAAGEIIERPAAVVKELVENSLDAAATRIQIAIEAGGTRSIRVRDDGEGMSPEDARLAFGHHATSKISSVDDLFAISTLGFRGEALPSIASVSRLRLTTVPRRGPDDPIQSGTEVIYEGGELIRISETAWTSGTAVLVEDLFFNVPARRKFLKTIPTEFGHVARQVMHYALARPEVEFRFHHQERPVFEAPAAASLQERIYQVLGEEFLNHLVPVSYQREGVEVSGFTSLPHEQRSSATTQYLFVNGRMVRDRVLIHAIRTAYRDLIPASAHPVVILFVRLDPRQVDVNVHPCKTEIRFRDSNSVHSAIFHALEEGLLKGSRQAQRSATLVQPLAASSLLRTQNIGQHLNRYLGRHSEPGFSFPVSGLMRESASQTAWPSSDATALAWSSLAEAEPRAPAAHLDEIPETAHLSSTPLVLGQFVESFIVAADREGVLLIDQHVAHERILYDRSLRALESSSGVPRQKLLIPVTVELNLEQRAFMSQLMESLNANGFEIEWFGGGTVVVQAVPAVAPDLNVKQVLEDLLERPDEFSRDENGSGQSLLRLREKIAISLACRAAIKINTPLSREKMQWLLDELFQCSSPLTCPHGRPILLRIGIEELLRGFHRI